MLLIKFIDQKKERCQFISSGIKVYSLIYGKQLLAECCKLNLMSNLVALDFFASDMFMLMKALQFQKANMISST